MENKPNILFNRAPNDSTNDTTQGSQTMYSRYELKLPSCSEQFIEDVRGKIKSLWTDDFGIFRHKRIRAADAVRTVTTVFYLCFHTQRKWSFRDISKHCQIMNESLADREFIFEECGYITVNIGGSNWKAQMSIYCERQNENVVAPVVPHAGTNLNACFGNNPSHDLAMKPMMHHGIENLRVILALVPLVREHMIPFNLMFRDVGISGWFWLR
jgi:hypothetical protein